MKISTEKPKIYERLKEVFAGIDWDKGIIITYGDTVYCKSGILADDIIVHEQVHLDQQVGVDPDEYAERFMSDRAFRYEKELEAYKAQAQYLRKTIKDKNKLLRRMNHIWITMATMYCGMITYEEAQKLI